MRKRTWKKNGGCWGCLIYKKIYHEGEHQNKPAFQNYNVFQ